MVLLEGIPHTPIINQGFLLQQDFKSLLLKEKMFFLLCEMLPTKPNSSPLGTKFKGKIMDEVNWSDASLFGLLFVIISF